VEDCKVIRKWFEGSTELTQDLSDKRIADFSRHATYKRFGPEEWIFKQGDHSDKFFVTLAGDMDVFVENYAQGQATNTISTGDGFGEVGLLQHGHKRSASVLSKSVVELMEVDHVVFKFVFAAHFKHLGGGVGLETLEEVMAAHKNHDVIDRQKNAKALRKQLHKAHDHDDAARSKSMRRKGRRSLHTQYLREKVGEVKAPSHSEALKYYKTHVQPKRLEVRDEHGKLISHRLAMPHERHLGISYNYWTTGASDFAHFSLGIGLYFYLLKGLFLLCFALFLLYIPVWHYYSSTKYSTEQNPISLRGSALCMRRVKVRLASSTEDNLAITEEWMNDCPLDQNIGMMTVVFALRQVPFFLTWFSYAHMCSLGYIVLASFLLLAVFIAVYNRAQKVLTEKMDVSVQVR
jgi:CRP-like cAMP-binding protein